MSQTVQTLEVAPSLRPIRLPGRLIAAGLALGLAHLPLLVAHGFELWGRPHYQFFPLVLFGAGVLAWPAWKAAVPAAAPNAVSWLLIGVNWLLLSAALVLNSPWLGAVAFLVLVSGLAHAYGGWRLVRALTPALAYLLLIIPPPFGFDTRLVNSLQTLTSKCANFVLDYFGVLHLMSGNLFEVAGKRYFVEEACSGINSLLSVLACTLFYVFWARTRWLRGILLLAAAVYWVIVANITRVVTIVLVDTRYGINLLKDPQHALLGLVLFGLVLLLLVSTDRFLLFFANSLTWGKRKKPVPAAPPAFEPESTPSAPLGWSFGLPIAVGYTLLVLLQVAGYAAGLGQLPVHVFDSKIVDLSNKFDADTLAVKFGDWQRDPKSGFTARDQPEMHYADHSRAWHFTRGPVAVTVSFDYPYPEWHDLRICYAATGWTIGETTESTQALPDHASPLTVTKFTVDQPPSRSGIVWFCSFDERGAPIEPLSVTEFRWGDRWKVLQSAFSRAGGAAPTIRRQVLQVQAFSHSFLPLGEQDAKDMEQLFLSAAQQLRQKFVAALASK